MRKTSRKYLVMTLLFIIAAFQTGCASEEKMMESSKEILDDYSKGSLNYEQVIDRLDEIAKDATSDEKSR